MTYNIIQAISQATLASTPQATQPGVAMGVLITMILGLGTIFGLVYKFYQFRQQLTAWQQSAQAASQQSLQTQQQLTQARKKLADKQAQIDELTIGLGQQRKKTHSLQESIKELRAKLLEQTQLTQQAAKSKPAFAQIKEELAEKPATQTSRAEKTETKPSNVLSQEAALLKTAQAQINQLQQWNQEHIEKISLLNQELHKARKRQESTRRIDLVTKAKIKLLEDKLRQTGRQYYDAISELAALKGEVVPPLSHSRKPSTTHPNHEQAYGD